MKNQKHPQVAFTIISMMLVGTGSSYAVENAQKWQSHVEPRSPLSIERTNVLDPKIDVRTPLEHLKNIRATLNPPIAELATLFEVSRQAIYKWLAQDSSPEEDKLKLITTLSKIADSFTDAGIHRSGALLHMKNVNGQSLFDLLKAKLPYEKHVSILIAEAQAMEAAYERSGLAQSNALPTNDWQATISLPSFREEA